MFNNEERFEGNYLEYINQPIDFGFWNVELEYEYLPDDADEDLRIIRKKIRRNPFWDDGNYPENMYYPIQLN